MRRFEEDAPDPYEGLDAMLFEEQQRVMPAMLLRRQMANEEADRDAAPTFVGSNQRRRVNLWRPPRGFNAETGVVQ